MRSITYVAEIGSMHKRSKSLAYELMRQAKAAGATIAKFQFGWPDDDSIRYVDDWAPDIAQWSKDIGIEWMASVFSLAGLSVAQSVGMQKYKVAHQIALDPAQDELFRAILAADKPTYVSGKPMTTWFQGGREDLYSIYVHANEYPCYEPHMPKDFQGSGWYGYSSHAHGVGDALLAIGRGARYVEKHFCLSKPDLWVRDTTFALDPTEFGDMVKYGNEIARVLGNRSP
jgi:sialic acid synthase SpsE